MIISLVPFIKITFIHAIRSAFIINKVEIFIEQREVVFLSPSKIC